MRVCPNFFFRNFWFSDFGQDGQTNDQNPTSQSPGLPPGWLEHHLGGREGGQEQVSHLQAGQEGQGDGGGEGNGEKTWWWQEKFGDTF